MITADDVAAAATRLQPYLPATPLSIAEPMSERLGATVAIKSEHLQRTGSFKIRGALHKLLVLGDAARRDGVVTASSGNHGIAVATAAAMRGAPCTVHLPSGASTAKVEAIRRQGATVEVVDSRDAYDAEVAAREAATRYGAAYVSPYNDADVVAGQGTCAVELTAQAQHDDLGGIDAVVVAVGGGGLISGIATWLRQASPATTVVGASPANDHAMAASVAAGRVVTPPASPTFSDGTAGALEPGTITFASCRSLVDEWTTVTERAIAAAVAGMIDDHHQLVEGAAGVALAAAQRYAAAHPDSTIVVVACGANVSSPDLGAMLRVAHEHGRASASG